MLASDVATWDHIAVGANNAWLQFDATKGADMTLGPKLARKILDGHLGSMLTPSATPTKGQLVLGLTIAAQDGTAMPKAVRDFLRAAAGGKTTSAFPAALKVGDLLKTAGEDQILEDIGLSATSPTITGSGASATVSINANVDTNADGTKDSFVAVNPFETKVTASILNVRAKPNGAIIDTVKKGDIVRVMGRIIGGTWTLVDHGGKSRVPVQQVPRTIMGVAVTLVCATCSSPETAMSAPTPPILSTFKQLKGGGDRQAIVPGPPLATVGGYVTWWNGDTPEEIVLPGGVNGYGTRWQSDGKLRVGLGTVDLKTRTWREDPALRSLVPRTPRGSLRRVAWSTDTAHVALLLQYYTSSSGSLGKQEIVIAGSDARVRGRVDVTSVTEMAASTDRVLVIGAKPQLLDLDGKVIAEPNLTIQNVNEGAGMFSATIPKEAVVLLRPSDGTVIARWDVETYEAVPVPHGIVAISTDGIVRVGCLQGNAIKEVAKVATGQQNALVQHVGDRIAVVSNGMWVANFSNPCH